MRTARVNEKSPGPFEYSGVRAITAATVLGTIGALTILVMPGFLGVMVEAFGFNDRQLGLLASVQIFTNAIATGVTTVAISRINWRLLGLAAMVILAAGNVLSILMPGFSGILVARCIAGIGEGIAIAVCFSALGITRDPDRSFGIYLVFALIFSAVVLYIFPIVFAWGGHRLVFYSLTGLSLAGVLLLPWLSPQSPERKTHSHHHLPLPYKLVGVGLAMVTFFFIGQGAVWSYLERMGAARAIDPETVSAALSLSALAGIAGAGIAMLLGKKVRRSVSITVGVVAQVISMLMLASEFDEKGFIAAVMIFNFSWNLCQPYLSGVMSELDPEGRVVVLMGSLQTIGVAVGPLIASMTMGSGEYQLICYLGIGTVLISLALTYLLLGWWKGAKDAALTKETSAVTGVGANAIR
jgi:DHA1 family inner membrane transport protein